MCATILTGSCRIPWAQALQDQEGPQACAGRILDEDHFGLDKVKERILEHIAVLNLVKEMKGQILCLVGPPGVGKTSLAKSIARALGRNFVRISLGGVRDEAEIRGHRRTYIGSMPGKIIQSMKRPGDQSDVAPGRSGQDEHGLPRRPARRCWKCSTRNRTWTFNDHYLDIDYDLSHVMFITTANVARNPASAAGPDGDHSAPRLPRGRKREIARRYMIPKQLKEHGLDQRKSRIQTTRSTRSLTEYTREAGVRNLEREIATSAARLPRTLIKERTQEVGEGDAR